MTKLQQFSAASAALVVCAALAGDAAATVSYAYDDLGRVISITYDNGTQVLYSYDAAGNRTQHVVNGSVNIPPSAVNDAKTIATAAMPTDSIMVLANDTDPDNDLLAIQSATTPLYGTATISGGASYITYSYTASIALPATDTFTYTISDGRGGSATATVTVQLIVGNSPPVANADTGYVLGAADVDMFITLDPRVNDTDANSDPLTVTTVANGSSGTVAILNAGTAVKYTRTSNFPLPGFTVSDSFSYTISDGQGGTATASVDVTLEKAPDCGGAGQPPCP